MGSGTDIAKSAGDVVILDDSIFSISRTILYGRTIFKSIRKFIKFQLIMNLAACGITLIGQILGIDNPITIIQMLWVNIIMDTLGGLAFAGEPPLDYYMKEKPKRRDEPIITREMVGEVLGNGIFTLGMLVAFLTLNYFKDFYSNSAHHLTAFYALFIFAGLFNCLSARGDRFFIFSKIGKNKPFIFIMLFISVIQILIVYYGGTLFRSTPLSFHELGFAILTALAVLAFDTVRRIFKKLSR
jgi:magnesium-transporting ATPase (P-type)